MCVYSVHGKRERKAGAVWKREEEEINFARKKVSASARAYTQKPTGTIWPVKEGEEARASLDQSHASATQEKVWDSTKAF